MGLEFRVSRDVLSEFPGLGLAWRLFERVSDPTAGAAPQVTPPADVSLETLKDHPVVRAYRDLSWRVGIDPTKRRPSGEALARRVLGGQSLPRIHPLVDAYNRASAATLVPLSAFDAETLRTRGTPLLARATAGEPFHGIAREPEELNGHCLLYTSDAADE